MKKISAFFRILRSKKQNGTRTKDTSSNIITTSQDSAHIETAGSQDYIPRVNKNKRPHQLLFILAVVTILASFYFRNNNNFVSLYYNWVPSKITNFFSISNQLRKISHNFNYVQKQFQWLFGHKQEYRSDYWGFTINFPETFEATETDNGVVVANYDWLNTEYDYKLHKDDVIVEVSVIDNIIVNSWSNSGFDVGEYGQFRIAGKLIKLYTIFDSSPVRNENKIITAEIPQEGFTYRLKIETGWNSFEEAKRIITSLKFIEREEFPPPPLPVSNGMKRFISTRLGFAFDYPDDWSMGSFDPFRTEIKASGEDQYVTIALIPRYLSRTNNLLEELKHEASKSCAADGPGSSIYCLEDSIKIKTEKNSFGAEEFIIQREKIFDNHGRITSYHEVVVAFPLYIQEYYAIMISPMGLAPEIDNQAVLEIGKNFQYLVKQ